MKPVVFVNLLMWASFASFAQTPSPSFDVVAVKPVALGSTIQTSVERQRSFAGAGGRVYLRAITLGALIIGAFQLEPDQLSGPAWLNTQAFDISAAAPADTGKDKTLLMLQTLLAERFHLKYHRETSITPVYALTVAPGGAKLRPGISDPEPEKEGQIGTTRGSGPGAPMTVTARAPYGIYTLTVADRVNHYDFQNMTMAHFAQFLSQAARRALELPVIDMTQMSGRYQVALDISQAELLGQAASRILADQIGGADPHSASDPSGSSLRTSIEKQGLRLIRRDTPLEKFIVDAVEKTPIDN